MEHVVEDSTMNDPHTQQVAEALQRLARKRAKSQERGVLAGELALCADLAPAVVRYGRANTPYGTPSSVIRAVRAAALASLTEGT